MTVGDVCARVAESLDTDPGTVKHIVIHLPGWDEADLDDDIYDDDRLALYLVVTVGKIIQEREVEAALAPPPLVLDPTGVRTARWRLGGRRR
jgi:hypothetical protein